MDLFEYQGKELFTRWDIAVPGARLATTPGEAEQAAHSLGSPVVVKAQVQAGGRGKAGGVRIAADAGGAVAAASAILGMTIGGRVVESVLVEKALEIKAEYYAAVTLDRGAGTHLFMVSSKGGMDIEEVAAAQPEAIARLHVDPLLGLAEFQVRRLVFGAGLHPDARDGAMVALPKLYRLAIEADATMVEVNPLVLTSDGDVVALDSKVSLDDSALFRHPELQQFAATATGDPQERMAKQRGLNFLKLGGNIGIIGNGAGLVMSTIDLVDQAGGRAANFLDVGGGAGVELLSSALEVILSDEDVRSVVINIFGGITRCDLVARGIVDAVGRLAVRVPVVVRLDGTNAEKGRRILAEANHPMITPAETMLEAARRGVEAIR